MFGSQTNIVIFSIYALIPVALIMLYVYRRDRFPEPVRIVSITFLLGVATIFPISLLIPVVEGFEETLYLSGEAPYFYEAFVRAAFLEETAKWAILLLFCIKANEFNEPMDALVYGVAVSLGFAAYENWDYVLYPIYENDLELATSIAILRSFTAVPLHATAGVFMGLFLIRAIFGKSNHLVYVVLSLLFPVSLHGTYNYILISPNIDAILIYPLLIVFILAVIYIFRKERLRQDKKYFEVENKHGTISKSYILSTIAITLALLTLAVIILNT